MDAVVASIITSIITTLLSVGGSLAVCLINNSSQTKKTRAEIIAKQDERHQALKEQVAKIESDNRIAMKEMQLAINSLKVEIEKINAMIDRINDVDKRVAVLEEAQKVANHRIDDLEKRQN